MAFLVLREGPLNADVRTHELLTDDITRSYRIVVPHQTSTPAAIVFAFHGTGDSPDSMAAYSRLDRVAAGNGFILVYPTAQNSMWSTINFDPANLDANPDVQFFDALLAHVASIHDIDRDRVYLTGMSNGGSFVQLLAVARATQIAALVAHSGLRPKELNRCDATMPIMLIVGADDSVAPIMESDAEQYRTFGHSVEYVRVPRLAHEWSTHHNVDMWRFLSDHVRHVEEAEQSDGRGAADSAFPNG